QAAQELGGEFTDLEGAMFKRDSFAIVDVAPKIVYAVRAWDLASTEQKNGNDPDWTAGVLIGRTPHATYCVLDAIRCRNRPHVIDQVMLRAAERDGHSVLIYCEQDPGSAGAIAISHLLRNVFAGRSFFGEKSTGPKATRAQPLAAQAERGCVTLLRG